MFMSAQATGCGRGNAYTGIFSLLTVGNGNTYWTQKPNRSPKENMHEKRNFREGR
jgi:hypothetical protein